MRTIRRRGESEGPMDDNGNDNKNGWSSLRAESFCKSPRASSKRSYSTARCPSPTPTPTPASTTCAFAHIAGIILIFSIINLSMFHYFSQITQQRLAHLESLIMKHEELVCKTYVTEDRVRELLGEEVVHKTNNYVTEYRVRELLEDRIDIHEADGIGRADYALANTGSFVTAHSPAHLVGEGEVYDFQQPYNMLTPSFGQVGEYFCQQGQSTWVEISLFTPIVPEAFTLEHVAECVSFGYRRTAPKDCKVTGWLLDGSGQRLKTHLLAEFTYKLEEKNLQTFNVSDSYAMLSSSASSLESVAVQIVRFEVLENHGSNATCTYRFRVHGHEF